MVAFSFATSRLYFDGNNGFSAEAAYLSIQFNSIDRFSFHGGGIWRRAMLHGRTPRPPRRVATRTHRLDNRSRLTAAVVHAMRNHHFINCTLRELYPASAGPALCLSHPKYKRQTVLGVSPLEGTLWVLVTSSPRHSARAFEVWPKSVVPCRI